MNKLMISVLTAGSMIAMAASAGAQTAPPPVTGTVNITGSVAPKCFVVPGAGSTFERTVNFNELAAADGTLRPGLAAEFATAGVSARVVCTSGNAAISVDADAITAATATAGVSGYDNSIDFDAHVAVTTTTGAAGPFSNDSADVPLVAASVGGRLANNGSDNILITADNFRTNATGDLLVADPVYTGKITVVIAPSA